MIWERVATGRYATEHNGHILQAVRRDGPFEPTEKPYVAVVDRVPVGDAWNLAHAKTKAIQYVERENGKAKAERAFRNGPRKPEPAAAPIIPDIGQAPLGPRVDAMLLTPDTVELVEVKPRIEPEARPTPEPIPEPAPDPEPDTAVDVMMAQLGQPGQLAITGRLADSGDLLDTLNALRSALELLREHAELDCIVNLPPTIKL